ncbi:MAG: zinc ribbon domain-containing protein [Acidobacteria bacterium]|nr:zinc ribbon domain-containing protein [Acidobacteriota bacterium]
MSEDSAFLVLLRRTLITLLILLIGFLCSYLLLVRFNKAQSYKRGMNAINQSLELWPGILSQLDKLRGTIKLEQNNDSLLNNPRFSTLLDSIAVKQRERIVVSGVRVSIYVKFYLHTSNLHIVPLPGNISSEKQEKDSWLPTTVEVIATQQDILLADFIDKNSQPTWAMDPLELENRINSSPGVLSWVLAINAPGGYEQTLNLVYQILLMIISFLVFFVPTYVWYDSKGRYRHAVRWTILVGATNLAGLLLYLLIGRVFATTCPECHQAVNEKQKFCPYCRVSLKTECRHCGQAFGRNWQFCASCGHKPERE